MVTVSPSGKASGCLLDDLGIGRVAFDAVEVPLCRAKPSEYIRSGRIYFSCEANESLLPVVAAKISE